MFHEICLAPFKQIKKFRSPDVALLPFVGGSTQAVMTPLWMPGLARVAGSGDRGNHCEPENCGYGQQLRCW